MSDDIDRARESIEEAHHHAMHDTTDPFPRRVAILVSVLAVMLAVAEMGAKGDQNEALTHHITASDTYAFYQAKTIRSTVRTAEAETLDSVAAGDPAVHARAEAARAEAARLDDEPGREGRKQLQERAHEQEKLRDESFHRYHQYEMVVGGLQIAIVLASVAVVTRMRALAAVAALLGLGGGIYGLLVASGLL